MKFLIFLLLPISIYTQQILSSGGNAPSPQTISERTISYTIGEPLITTGGDDKIITQGFQQPNTIGKVYTSGVNAFSPNNDGNNDTWKFKKKSEDYRIEIFSRWGNIVWDNKADLTLTEWDGLDKNNEPVPDGTYFYTITSKGQKVENGSSYIEVTR